MLAVKKNDRGPKKTPRGADFYRLDANLRPILVYVPKDVHDALKRIAADDDRSLQKTVKRILADYARGRRKGGK